MKRQLLLFLIAFCIITNSTAQTKKPIDHTVYDSWQHIEGLSISDDGNSISYIIQPQEGDGMLFIKNTKTGQIDSIPRGYQARFSPKQTHLIARIKPFFQETRKAKIAKKKTEELPKDSLLIYTLATGAKQKIPQLKSYTLAEKDMNMLVYHVEKPIDTSKSSKSDNSSKEGSPLVAILLGTDITFNQPYVTEYALSKNGKSIVIETNPSKKDSINKVAFKAAITINELNIRVDTISRSSADASKYSWDETGDQLSYISTVDSSTAKIKKYVLRYYKHGMDSARVIVPLEHSALSPANHISDNYTLRFSNDGQRILAGIAPIPIPKDTTIPEMDEVKVDIWHYNDDYLQTMQLKNADAESKKSFLAVYNLLEHTFTPLASDDLENVTISDQGNGRYAMGRTDKGQRIALQWEGDSKEDIYSIDLKSNTKKLIADNLDGMASLSPLGKYIVWYDLPKKNYFIYDNAAGITRPLTDKIKVPLADEENDSPDDPQQYGVCGWAKDDQKIYIYDRWDIWEVDPKGIQLPSTITKGLGRATKTSFRNIRLDDKELFFQTDQNLLLSALQDADKKRGYYSLALNGQAPPALLRIEENSFPAIQKAKNAQAYIFTKGNFTKSPDVYSTSDFKELIQHTNTNPQQAHYNWGTVELLKWNTFKNKKGSGLLYKPENFDPNKKYPMIVYFYEKMTETRYMYTEPAPTPSRLNIPYFVSNEYLVFVPDISYEIGYPGPSAYDHVVSGVEMLKKNKWVDGANMALQGQSWGGYQSLYIITRTNQFKAAWAGAPVVNMFSAYGGIRWESGRNRQMQYEKSQSRIGATPWQRRDLYIQNSPFFELPKVTTPLVIMANDADGAVPWYQGIETFTAMRRLGKKVWMLNYNGEAHNLVERKNRKDISIREGQFFDYLLKGKQPAEWLEKGVPAVDKGKNMGLKLVEKS